LSVRLFSLMVRTVLSSKPSGRRALISSVISTSQPSWLVRRWMTFSTISSDAMYERLNSIEQALRAQQTQGL
jgi:hypothetical protein